jgi:hypothetical protein
MAQTKESATVPASGASAPVEASAPVTQASSPVAASAPTASAPAASEPASSPAPTIKPVLIEIHGDDAMFGAMPPTFVANAQSEPADTQAILRDQLSTDQVTVSNLAEGGLASTALNFISGLDGEGAPYAQRVMTSKAQIVLASYGVNDDLSQSLGPYEDALIAFILDTRAAGKIPVLEEAGPVCDDQHPYLQNFASVVGEIAQSYNVPLVTQYNELLAIPNLCSHMTGIYPDNFILQQRAQRQAAVLQPIVQSLMK